MTPRRIVSVRRPQAGYVLLAVLLLSVLMVSMTMTFARHSLLAADGTTANLRAQSAEQAAGSGFAWAKQSLLADGASNATLQISGDAAVTVSLAGAGSARHAITIAASGPGTTQQVSATVETYATLNGQLPALTVAAKTAVTGAASRIDVNSDTTYSDTELTGILYVKNGKRLRLRNVILTGAIVSEPAVLGTWTPAQATSIELQEGVLIEPGATLPGCVIIAPDALVTGTATSRVQLQGVIVAAGLTLPGTGAVHGQVATAAAPVLSASIDLPGSGRAPRAWPSALDTGAEGLSRVIFDRARATQGEKDAIGGFSFPPRGGG